MPMFDKDDLERFIDQATWVTVNDYESELMQERTGLTPDEIASRVRAFIVTRGADGSWIYTAEGRIEIPSAKPKDVVDPTGCGDAYRAGLLYGLMNDMVWEATGRIASLMGALKIECAGTQNHHFDRDGFAARYAETFQTELEW
jgi:adenosine kinase